MGVAESKGRCDLSSKYYDYFTVQRFSEPILGVNKTFSLKERYVLEEQLGWGQFGVIRTCRDKITGEILACKSIAKDRLMTSDDVRSVKLEIEIMTKLSGHPNVVDLKDVFEEEDYVHLVMELCAGGELFHQLEKHGQFSESDARAIFKHLMQVVLYCHENGVVHRDLKPENILLATKASPSSIKLADFGLATYIKPGQSLQGIVGSPFYIAPEVLVGDYNQAADVWSAGVILYILLSGMPPFWGKTKSSIFDAVKAADLQFPSDPWDRISESARTLIQGMLCVDPSQRLSAQEVLDHSWMEDPGTDASTLKAQDNRTSGECKVSEDSFSSSYVCRDHDISFGTGSYMICDTQSPKLSCRSSFSSFFVEPMTPCTATRGGFSFGSYENSNNLEFCSPVSSMPSFAFSPGTSNEEGTIELLSFSQVSHSGSILGGNSEGTLLVLPSSVVLAENKGLETEGRAAEVKTIGGSGHGVPCIHSKRNRTIGLGPVLHNAKNRDVSVTYASITVNFLLTGNQLTVRCICKNHSIYAGNNGTVKVIADIIVCSQERRKEIRLDRVPSSAMENGHFNAYMGSSAISWLGILHPSVLQVAFEAQQGDFLRIHWHVAYLLPLVNELLALECCLS